MISRTRFVCGRRYVIDSGDIPNGQGFASLRALPGPDQTQNGGSDAFVAKLTP